MNRKVTSPSKLNHRVWWGGGRWRKKGTRTAQVKGLIFPRTVIKYTHFPRRDSFSPSPIRQRFADSMRRKAPDANGWPDIIGCGPRCFHQYRAQAGSNSNCFQFNVGKYKDTRGNTPWNYGRIQEGPSIMKLGKSLTSSIESMSNASSRPTHTLVA